MALASLRLVPTIEIAETPTTLWLRGQPSDEALELKLSSLPTRERFELLPSNQLRRTGHRVPSAKLPELSWQPLNTWLKVKIPVAALPGTEPGRIAIQLVRSSDEREPELLLTTLEEFAGFAKSTAQVRLDRLQFAASADGRVLVRGKPLPPLPGQHFVLQSGFAVAAGFTWKPTVSAEVLARRFDISGGTLVLWNDDGTIVRFHEEQFVPATRSAVVATTKAVEESK